MINMYALLSSATTPLQSFGCPYTGEGYVAEHERVVGRRDCLGIFATAALAQYPVQMNKVVAEAIWRYFDEFPVAQGRSVQRRVLVLFSGHDDDIAGLPQALSGMGLAVAVLMW